MFIISKQALFLIQEQAHDNHKFLHANLNLNLYQKSMKKTALLLALGVTLAACNNKKADQTEASLPDTVSSLQAEPTTDQSAIAKDSIDWAKVPELKEIGAYPFFIPGDGLEVADAKDGLSEVLEYEKIEVYNGKGISTAKGKLGLMSFGDQGEKRFNKLTFDDNISGYVSKLGALKVYQGPVPREEELRKKLSENLWTGKKRTFGIADDEPFSIYAFRNAGKRYLLSFQSNSAQAEVLVMELK